MPTPTSILNRDYEGPPSSLNSMIFLDSATMRRFILQLIYPGFPWLLFFQFESIEIDEK
jgi:hypothetical protein